MTCPLAVAARAHGSAGGQRQVAIDRGGDIGLGLEEARDTSQMGDMIGSGIVGRHGQPQVAEAQGLVFGRGPAAEGETRAGELEVEQPPPLRLAPIASPLRRGEGDQFQLATGQAEGPVARPKPSPAREDGEEHLGRAGLDQAGGD